MSSVPPSQWKPRGEIVTRAVAGETILVPVRNRVGDLNSIFTLNETGALIWDMIGTRATRSQIVEAVAREFDVPSGDAERDALEFIASLEAAGLIVPCESN